jgi:hypothetical protein
MTINETRKLSFSWIKTQNDLKGRQLNSFFGLSLSFN